MSCTVALSGLVEATDEQIEGICGIHGKIVAIEIHHCKTRAMVTFEDGKLAAAAAKALKEIPMDAELLENPMTGPDKGSLLVPPKVTKGNNFLEMFHSLSPKSKKATLLQMQGFGDVKQDFTVPVGSSQGTPLFVKTHIEPPRLPFFSGDGKDCFYLQWKFEVSCLASSGTYPAAVLLQAIRRSVRGKAGEVLVNLGADATVSQIISKFDARFGEVLSVEQLLAKFYESAQDPQETVSEWACRLEDVMHKARFSGKLTNEMADHMLRTKFWSGMKSEYLKSALRSRVEGGEDFDSLLRYARTIEQEVSADSKDSVGSKKGKSAQLSVQQASFSGDDQVLSKLEEILKQMRTLDGRVQKLERQKEGTLSSHGSDSSRSDQSGQGNDGSGSTSNNPARAKQGKFQGSSRGGRKFSKEQRRCFKCGGLDHFIAECPEN